MKRVKCDYGVRELAGQKRLFGEGAVSKRCAISANSTTKSTKDTKSSINGADSGPDCKCKGYDNDTCVWPECLYHKDTVKC